MHLLFVDIKKAFDSVPLVKLWQMLENTNINIEIIKSKGLKQECSISSTLYTSKRF